MPGKRQDVHDDLKLTFHEFGAEDVRKAFAASKLHLMQIILVDSKYRAMAEDDWKKVVAKTTDAWKKYRSEYFDCDDFARCQAALVSLHYDCNGCGQVYDSSGKHSYNCLLVSGGASLSVDVLEPQSGSILDKSMLGKGHYAETQGFIIL